MAWVTVPDSDVDPESPVTTGLMIALRDNPIAIAGRLSGAPLVTADEIYEQEGGNNIKNTIFDIGSWNMDTTANKIVGYGAIVFANIRFVMVTIRRDDNIFEHNLEYVTSGGAVSGGINIKTTDIALFRIAGGLFDSVNFDVMGDDGDRGWVWIWYVDP